LPPGIFHGVVAMRSMAHVEGPDAAPHPPAPAGEVIKAGELEVRPSEFLAVAGGRALSLSIRELDLLAALARRPDRIVSREELYRTVWGEPLRATDRSVDVYVHKLRTKLARALPEWAFIHTHFGFGYRFSPERSRPFHNPVTDR
jgi:DNA-binding response OmpR family regulator